MPGPTYARSRSTSATPGHQYLRATAGAKRVDSARSRPYGSAGDEAEGRLAEVCSRTQSCVAVSRLLIDDGGVIERILKAHA